ncbi:hypothetical protein SB00610_04778 [Klebsiella quasipneumoniae subsp. similipneumoniae]|nr:hypothetical protein SB00610_04778 [Klebsiella quasipneumoniae subsp. similipneumoniae]
MAVFAVAHILLLNEVQIQGAWEAASGFFAFAVIGRNHAAEVVGDHAVIRGVVFEGFNGEVEAGVQRQGAFVGFHLINDGGVVAALHHDGDVFVVLRRGADHGRAADIDVFHRVFQRASFASDGLGKRIEVNDHHIDRRDPVLLHDAVILTATAEDAAVYFRMQGFHASIHHFRETGVVRDFGYRQAFICQQASGAASGQQLDTTSGKRLREFDDTGLVRNTEQSAADWTTLLHGIKSPGFEHYRER